MEEARDNPRMATGEVKGKKEVVLEAQRETRRKSTLLHWWTYVTWNTWSYNPNYKKNQGRVVLHGDIVKDDSGAYAVFTEQGSSAQMTAAKSNGCYCKATRLYQTSSWCSICLHSCKIWGRSQIARNSQVRMFSRVDTSATTHMAEIMDKHWRSSGTSRTYFIWTIIRRLAVGETIRGNVVETWMGKKYRIGSVCLFIEDKDYSHRYTWMTSRWL